MPSEETSQENSGDIVEVRGRLHSRNPQTGLKRVSATVRFFEQDQDSGHSLPLLILQQRFPAIAEQLKQRTEELEQEMRDAVEFDFRVDEGGLSIESPRPLECSPEAAVKVARSLVQEGVLSIPEALLKVPAESLRTLLLPSFEGPSLRRAEREGNLLAQGEGSGEGAVSGVVVFDPKSAWRFNRKGQRTVLVCDHLSYRERDALTVVGGVLVCRGSLLAARGGEIPGVTLPELRLESGKAFLGEQELKEGDRLSLDARSGRVFRGEIPLVEGGLTSDALQLLQWADRERTLKVRANAGSPEEARLAVVWGAEGIGLCRFELLMLAPNRLALFQEAFREICLSECSTSPTLDRLAEELEGELLEMFEAFAEGGGTPFTLRLMDSPVSQMLNHWRVHSDLPADYFTGPLNDWMEELSPMQGLRCGRLAVVNRALLRFQVRTVLGAWERGDRPVRLQVMMPGVTDRRELEILREVLNEEAAGLHTAVPEIGSMLELPRACLTAGSLAEAADFLSFGTGDLTESTCGLSRYDCRFSFLPAYLDEGVFSRDPFRTLDLEGVGALMKLGIELVNESGCAVELGTCGAQATDPESLRFCHRLGLKYVSVPVEYLPVARLAAAQARLLG